MAVLPWRFPTAPLWAENLIVAGALLGFLAYLAWFVYDWLSHRSEPEPSPVLLGPNELPFPPPRISWARHAWLTTTKYRAVTALIVALGIAVYVAVSSRSSINLYLQLRQMDHDISALDEMIGLLLSRGSPASTVLCREEERPVPPVGSGFFEYEAYNTFIDTSIEIVRKYGFEIARLPQPTQSPSKECAPYGLSNDYRQRTCWKLCADYEHIIQSVPTMDGKLRGRRNALEAELKLNGNR